MGCTPSDSDVPEVRLWDGEVQQWGTLREVMHGEVMDGQVRLSDVTGKPHVYGVGAADRLHGEVIIVDGAAWVSDVQDGDRVNTRRSSSPEDSAVFLAIAEIPAWTEVRVDRDVPAEEFDDFIQSAISKACLAETDTVPFVIEGQYASVELHVLNGQCPYAEVETASEGSTPPRRMKLDDARGLLVGFYSESGAGRITHHWTRTHVHALLGPNDDRLAGHVDALVVKAGAVIRVPKHRQAARS